MLSKPLCTCPHDCAVVGRSMRSSPRTESQREASLPLTLEQQGRPQHKEKLIFPQHSGSKKRSYQPLPHSQANPFLSKYTPHHYRSHLSCICRSHSHGRVMAQAARGSPAHRTCPWVALHQPTQHKLVQQAQTAAPAHYAAPAHDTHSPDMFPLCVWPTLQASAEKPHIPFVVVLRPQIRGGEEDVFPPLLIQAQNSIHENCDIFHIKCFLPWHISWCSVFWKKTLRTRCPQII